MTKRDKPKQPQETPNDLRDDADFQALVEDLKKTSPDDRDRLRDWLNREVERGQTDESDKSENSDAN
jgi:hypothetical protein